MTIDIIEFNFLTTEGDGLNITTNQTIGEDEKAAATNWTTGTRNTTTVQFPFQPNYVVAVLYLIAFIVGVNGNLLLLIINVWRRNSKHAVTQMFICSLAVSDLGLMLTCTWMNGFTMINPSYIFGRFFCKLGNIWKSLTANTSAMILTVIGVDRYMGLERPGSSVFSVRGAAATIAGVWVVAISCNIPMFLWFDIMSYGPKLWCTVVGVDTASISLFTLLNRIITFFVPLGVTLGCYVGIWYKMAFSKKKMAAPANSQSTAKVESSRKVARMCTLVVAVFTLSWAPFQAAILYYAYGSDKVTSITLMSNLFILANINSCINPIIYGFMWRPTRTAISQIFLRCCGKIAINKIHTSATVTTKADTGLTTTVHI